MRVFGLTELGRRIASTKDGSDEETRVLQFIKENRAVTDDELEVIGGESYMVRHLKERGLVKELTQG